MAKLSNNLKGSFEATLKRVAAAVGVGVPLLAEREIPQKEDVMGFRAAHTEASRQKINN